jgi:hypothetical protein
VAMTAALVACGASTTNADVKTQERTQVKFEGMLGRMVGLFGGRAARDGIVSTVVIKGDRQMTSNGDAAELIDLAEEKVYQIDLDKKTYKVMTFAEIRKQFEEAQRKAEESARKSQPAEQQKGDEPQFEIDFDMKESGQKRAISGYDTREVVMTVTVREKGKTLEQSGGLVLTSNSWLAPEIAAMKEQEEFSRRYAQKLYGELVSVEAMQRMAAAMAIYPGIKDAMERMSKENVNLTGTPLLTTMTFQSVANAQQAEQQKEQEEEKVSASPGGLMGGLARRIGRRNQDQSKESATPGRATILTSTSEVLKISTEVAADDVAVPAGFRQAK